MGAAKGDPGYAPEYRRVRDRERKRDRKAIERKREREGVKGEGERKSGQEIYSRIQARRFNGVTWKFRDEFPHRR